MVKTLSCTAEPSCPAFARLVTGVIIAARMNVSAQILTANNDDLLRKRATRPRFLVRPVNSEMPSAQTDYSPHFKSLPRQ